jgi:hypothetical protein
MMTVLSDADRAEGVTLCGSECHPLSSRQIS